MEKTKQNSGIKLFKQDTGHEINDSQTWNTSVLLIWHMWLKYKEDTALQQKTMQADEKIFLPSEKIQMEHCICL